jgi:hypothetical protein
MIKRFAIKKRKIIYKEIFFLPVIGVAPDILQVKWIKQ